MRLLPLVPFLGLLACGEAGPSASDTAGGGKSGSSPILSAVGEHALAKARCLACHEAPPDHRLAPLPSPSLTGIGNRASIHWLQGFLSDHHSGKADDATALAHYVASRTENREPFAAIAVEESEIDRGQALWQQYGCAACHRMKGIPDYARKTQHSDVMAFLKDPGATRPDLVHDFQVTDMDARVIATFLLREQLEDENAAPPTPGLQVEVFPMRIKGGGIPDLDGVQPATQTQVPAVDLQAKPRRNNYALRFRGTIEIPQSGEWKFTIGSDDGSWLWVDGKEVIENGGLKPHRRRSATVNLDAGSHGLEVLFTQGGGGASLEFLWEGPGVAEQVVPTSVLSARSTSLIPPTFAAVDPALAKRGEALFAAQRCNACHTDDGMPPPAASPPWNKVRRSDATCPHVDTPSGVDTLATAADPRSRTEHLEHRMRADGCTACHVRDGKGGMRKAARDLLPELQDLGEEGRIPPDLSYVGRRLRPEWTKDVLLGKHRVRAEYLRVKMPALDEARASEYAALFEEIDGGQDLAEPEFTAEAAERGRTIAGSKGFACISCHTLAGYPSTGVQGMDLSLQHKRVKPEWFKEWLLRPHTHRPDTRMTAFWPVEDEKARADVAAVRTWLSLGTAVPLPEGLKPGGSEYVVHATDRARLHGAFLKDLSGRCIAVGSPLRVHYAYDLQNQRLAWLWRGGFLDASGTWSGRAGKLLQPLGEDWVTLPKELRLALVGAADGQKLKTLGWKVDPDGYPIFRLGMAGSDIQIEDHSRPVITSNGAALRRSITVRGSTGVRLGLPTEEVTATVNGQAVDNVTINPGDTVEVLYQW